MSLIYDDFLDSGYKIFGLYGVNSEGLCACGNPHCTAPYKHPVAANWQHTPLWSEEQIEVMELTGQLDTGYGVLVDGLLVVDIDERNGGNSEQLGDLLTGCGFIIKTGSGGQSRHYYFKCPQGLALNQHLDDYKGIDFKSSGFVVGPGSKHASGNTYDVLFGGVEDINDAPQELLDLLKKPERYRASVNGAAIDVGNKDITDMLSFIDPGIEFDHWVRIGMAIHHCTGGNGLDLWDEWSQMDSKYKQGECEKRWHSFGKSASLVTLGTLMFHAEEGGYEQSVEFECTETFDYTEEETDENLPFPLTSVDLLRPPGFVGELTTWINTQCRYPRENLAVAASLTALGNIVGLRYTDDINYVTANMFAFCVAGSSSGKNDVLSAIKKIHIAAGIQSATHGSIKSEQEIIRNLIRHQASYYIYDELGEHLQKLINSKKTGGAAYLQGVIGMLMSVYSQADDYLLVTGDIKEEVTQVLNKELKHCKKQLDDNEDITYNNKRLIQLQKAIKEIDKGIEKPFLSLIGFTTPVTFDSLVTYEQATNGFIGRSLLVNERETNPRAKRGFKKTKMPTTMEMHLSSLYSDGEYSVNETRIEYYGDRREIKSTKEATIMLEKCLDWIEDHAEFHKEATGLEAIIRRGYELIAKVSLILAAPEGLRNEEHVRWAFALIQRDLEEKTRLAFANEREKSDPLNSISAKILSYVDKDTSVTMGYLKNRLKKSEDIIKKSLESLEKRKLLSIVKSVNNANKKETIKYFGV